MHVSRDVFNALLASDSPDVSISFYHECLHSIAFTHTKTLSIPRDKFIDPDSPTNPDGTTSIRFLPHWRGQLLLPLFTRLLRLYLKPQLRLTDDDYAAVLASFQTLSASDLNDVLGLSIKHLGRHLHIVRSISILERLCTWKSGDAPLDFFLHLGGTPMITIGDILIRDDVQYTLSRLLEHVGSPSLAILRSSRSGSHTSRSSKYSSHGSRIGSRVSFPTPPKVSFPTPPKVPVSAPSVASSLSLVQDSPPAATIALPPGPAVSRLPAVSPVLRSPTSSPPDPDLLFSSSVVEAVVDPLVSESDFSGGPLGLSANIPNAGPSSLGTSDPSSSSASWLDIMDLDCLPSLSSAGLHAFDYTSPAEPFYDTNLVPTLSSYDLDDDTGSVIEPQFDHLPPSATHSSSSVDPTSRYLYALDIHLQAVQSDRASFSRSAPSPPYLSPSALLPIRQLSKLQLSHLWHQRFGHLNRRTVANMHHYAKGVSPVSLPSELDSCPVCLSFKLHRAPRGLDSSRRASRCYQGLSIDFGFFVQRSGDSARLQQLQGLTGETCYCLIACHFSSMLFGEPFRSKTPPLDFLNRWLAKYGLPHEVPDKYVRMDQGGELGRCPDVISLFESAGYSVELTAPDSSHQNGPVERPHRTLGDAIRTMLAGASLEPRFWPYAFRHYLRLYNVMPHASRDASPYTICSGALPDLSLLRVFGCRVYVLPPRATRRDKLRSDTRTGCFLGYSHTMKNILYYDLDSHQVKTALHVVFDEAMSDSDQKSLNARLLRGETVLSSASVDLRSALPQLEISPSPFTDVISVDIAFDSQDPHPFGIEVATCSRLRRAYVTSFSRAARGRTLPATRCSFLGSYLLSISDIPVFHAADLAHVLARLCSSDGFPPRTVTLQLAPERRSSFDDRPSSAVLRLHDLRHISALRSITGEGLSSVEFAMALSDFRTPHSVDQMEFFVYRLQSSIMTDEERTLPKLTRRRLKTLSNWLIWDAACDKQLDAHYSAGVFLKPILRPQQSPGTRLNVLRIHWTYVVKDDGTRKAQATMDGSKWAAPWLREVVKTYASCVGQASMKLFFVIAAVTNKIILIADTTNSFQQSPPSTKPCFLEIDEAYLSWYKKKFGEDIDPALYVIPLGRALQGHPEAGALWEQMIVGILKAEFNFVATTHEQNLYRPEVKGEIVFVCRQVEDFVIAYDTMAVADHIISTIDKHVSTSNKGLGERYNGLDVLQTRNYVKLHCESYIDKILLSHGWSEPGAKESNRHDMVPLSPDTVERLQHLTGPAEGSKEHAEVERRLKFSYRGLLGELLYAFITIHIEIGNAIQFLSRFSTYPHEDHHLALKGVCRYLRKHKAEGLIYWRTCPVDLLPHVPFDILHHDIKLATFPRYGLTELVAFADAAYATDVKTRRSATGYIIVYGGAAVVYKAKLQATMATSSTEAEFIAAVYTEKAVKHLCSVLCELGMCPERPTMIFEDNKAAIDMINDSKATAHSRHIDFQHFAIQEWQNHGEIEMKHIPGVINPADDETKALSRILHSRHSRRAMSHYGPPDSNTV